MSWFDQLGIWDDGPQKKWRIKRREYGHNFAVAVLQRATRKGREGQLMNSECHADVLSVTVNAHSNFIPGALFSVQPGGDSLDNPCISIVWSNNKGLCEKIKEHFGDDAEMIEV